MEEKIKRNIFVYTRDKYKDYDYICRPTDYNVNMNKLINYIEQEQYRLEKEGNFTSKWYNKQLGESNNQIVFRIVSDGRVDMYGRPIKRYEGAILPNITCENISILEKCLQEVQENTNNYGYGEFSLTKNITNRDEKFENCRIEIKDNKIIIKSKILGDILEKYGYKYLIEHLEIDSNNINKDER